MFPDVGLPELVTLAILVVLLFGPDKLPEIIQNAAELIRKVRAFSDSAKEDIRSELGPDFKDFEFEDLHPKTFVRKHVLDSDDIGRDLGLDEIRSALDPRKDLAEVADAVRGAAHDTEPQAAAPQVTLEKADPPQESARSAFDPDAT
ncbi:sec-independent translocase [Streptomyces sp. NBC_00989]|uniref:sec-independent translocase n=1 Tax=Streptomyces sp. NBC_00989 TaxID=2903705 RepID=UPI00386F3EC8|nr:sec-independent translocase [Streptomyces sp. NBC_00989]